MSFFYNLYKKTLLVRYDKDVAIPYYKAEDFKGLIKEANTFRNPNDVEISYFFYYYPNPHLDKIILFLPGIGPGHVAYLREIDRFAKAGYKILTLDYEGCGESKGERLPSFNAPTKNVIDLLLELKLQEEIILIGHSLGGYTALNMMNLDPLIHQAIIISGFYDIEKEMQTFFKFPFLLRKLGEIEKENGKGISLISNYDYLSSTHDHIFWIHSRDDRMVSYKYNYLPILKLNNKHIKMVTVDRKHHNPNYTLDAVHYKDKLIKWYFKMIKRNVNPSIEKRKNYFKNADINRMTNQDEEVISQILDFIK